MPSDHPLYVLTLMNHGVELHKYSLRNPSANPKEDTDLATEEILLAHLPTNLQEALRYDTLDGQLQTHRHEEFLARRYMPAEHPEIEHADVEELSPKKLQKYLRRYLRELDNAICDLLRNSDATLRLAGDPEICALYRTLSEYPHVEPYHPSSQS